MLYAFDYDNSLSSFPQFQSGEIINELETIALDILEMILADRPPVTHPILPKAIAHPTHLQKIVIITRN
jgi:hypothetical protein